MNNPDGVRSPDTAGAPDLTLRERGDADPTAEIFPCADCGVLRSRDQGGGTFTVCDKCWDILYKQGQGAPATPSEPHTEESMRALLDEARKRVRPTIESRGSIVGAPGNWIAPHSTCSRCGLSLNWTEQGHHIVALCECKEYHSYHLHGAAPVVGEGAQPGEVERLGREMRLDALDWQDHVDVTTPDKEGNLPTDPVAIQDTIRILTNAAAMLRSLQSQLEEARKECGRLRTQRDVVTHELSALRERNTALVAIATEALEEFEACIPYAGEYFAQKWGMSEALERLRAALLAQEPSP